MTEQTNPQDAPPMPLLREGSALNATPLDRETIRRMNDERMRSDAAHRARMKAIDDAFRSPEAKRLREMILDDGNVGWREFVTHCGGILETLKLVDENGVPDVDRVVEKVDELFNTYVQKEIDAGSVFRRHPRNRPYQPGPSMEALRAQRLGEFPGDRGRDDVSEAIRQGENPFQPKPRNSR